ncbi:MAG: GDCCVxC domain-containing (seleno)protein [Xanthobacteraceae bacterium]
MIEDSTITCPHCGHRATERMRTDACQFFYDCNGCGERLKPKTGGCCVFCSYGSVPCPSIQAAQTGEAAACCAPAPRADRLAGARTNSNSWLVLKRAHPLGYPVGDVLHGAVAPDIPHRGVCSSAAPRQGHFVPDSRGTHTYVRRYRHRPMSACPNSHGRFAEGARRRRHERYEPEEHCQHCWTSHPPDVDPVSRGVSGQRVCD